MSATLTSWLARAQTSCSATIDAVAIGSSSESTTAERLASNAARSSRTSVCLAPKSRAVARGSGQFVAAVCIAVAD
jgi:hypothetical protein